MGGDMRTFAPSGPDKSPAVTVVGLATLLWGGAYAALGGQFIWAGASWAERAGDDPWGPLATFFGLLPALVIAVGVASLLLGLVGLLAGVGLLLRKPWGRVLSFPLSVAAILVGLVWVGGGDQRATEIALGVAQILFGVLTFTVLVRNGAEFSRPGLTESNAAALTPGRSARSSPGHAVG